MSLVTRFSLIFLIGLTALTGCRSASNQASDQAGQTAPQSNPEIERAYKKALEQVLAPYWQDNQVEGIQLAILELRAPAKYLELHLELVIAFELFEQGQGDQDQEKIEQALEKLSQLQQTYPWVNPYGQN